MSSIMLCIPWIYPLFLELNILILEINNIKYPLTFWKSKYKTHAPKVNVPKIKCNTFQWCIILIYIMKMFKLTPLSVLSPIVLTYSQFDSNIHVLYVFLGFLKNTWKYLIIVVFGFGHNLSSACSAFCSSYSHISLHIFKF
jgi:hypothetical protein